MDPNKPIGSEHKVTKYGLKEINEVESSTLIPLVKYIINPKKDYMN